MLVNWGVGGREFEDCKQMSGWGGGKGNRKGKGKRHGTGGKERCLREEEEADEETHP